MQINKKTGEIFIYDIIGQDFWGEGITDKAVIQALADIGNQRVTVRINSPGGDANQGISIFNALRRHAPGVDTVVDSLAASAASVIALAGENRTVALGGKFMIHRAMTFAFGNSHDLSQGVNVLKKYDDSQVDIYSQFMPEKTRDEIYSMMVAETWFDGAESVAVGLATAQSGVMAQYAPVASWFRHPPAAMLQREQEAKQERFIKRQAARATSWYIPTR